MQRAREAVKRKLQAQGIKVSLTPAAEITRLAEDYALAHRDELLHEAILRAQQIYPPLQNLGIEHRRRRPGNHGLLVCKSQVRNGSAE
jgi:hypothetical protein